ncbi:MAG: DNA-directed RNA polymerase subunit alpha [Dehalococcoidales bacterium]|nr:DNA-directed RNA polymerase subunit alpha [Dehalococcoidales bacterium]
MSHLVAPKIECVESRDNFGRFVIEPLDKGLGITLGNAMRRVLLGQLQGAAVTRVKIDGIQHEFTTVPNVKEDVIELLLNIKALRLKSISGRAGKLILEAKGEGEVSAADIMPSTDFEITNPDLHLATLDSAEARLYVELDVDLSKGYREAESRGNLSVGVIPVDAIFGPVRKVNFTIEPMRTEQEISHERLSLEVWTDGTISPKDAITHSAEILLEQLSLFVSFSRVAQIKEEPRLLDIPTEIYNMPIEQLNLSVRTLNCLRRGGISTVGEVMSRGEKELMSLRNFGQKSKQELAERLTELGLSFDPQAKEGEEEATTDETEESADLTAGKIR